MMISILILVAWSVVLAVRLCDFLVRLQSIASNLLGNVRVGGFSVLRLSVKSMASGCRVVDLCRLIGRVTP